MNQIKLFKHPLLNQMIFTNSLVAVSVYFTISVAVIVLGFTQVGISIVSGMVVVVVGLQFFTLVEYLVHRFLYHSDDNYAENRGWQYLVHGIHHVHPKEHGLLALPIPLALAVNGLLFFLFWLLLKNYAYFIFPGFLMGYATQLFIHYRIHTRKPPKNSFRFFWRHHMLHHYSSEKKAFGVITSFWDIVFDTMPPKKAVQEETEKTKVVQQAENISQ